MLKQAQTRVINHPQHALVPIYRHQIYRAIAEHPLGEEVLRWLALITAEFVLPKWQKTWPHSTSAQLLNMAYGVLAGTVEAAEAVKEAIEFRGSLLPDWQEEVADFQKNQFDEAISWYANMAIIEAVLRVVGQDCWADIQIFEYETDADLDLWTSDTALWASSAYAGAVWENDFDPAKRLGFWQWWLEEAIPSAWDKVINRPGSPTVGST